MSDKPKILFYHAHFFNDSETFIYHQARNPFIETLLLSKRFFNHDKFDFTGFEQIKFKRTLWDGILSNIVALFGIDRYYFGASVRKMQKLLSNHEFDLIHAQFGFSAVRILPLAKRMKKPLVVSFHGFDASSLLRKKAYRRGLRKVFDYCHSIVICNPAMADVLPLTGADRKKVHWVPYGVDLKQFTITVERPDAKIVNLLHVGRLIEKKGVPDLITAFAELLRDHDNIHLNLVGTGEEEIKCRALVDSFDIKNRVTFHGWKAPQEVKSLMQASHVFILNSRTARSGDMEGLPNGILEAMAMQMPVVSTQHAGIPKAIESEMEGILVAEKDNTALVQALSKLITSAELRRQLGTNARKKVESEFTTEKMHQNLAQIYRSSLGN